MGQVIRFEKHRIPRRTAIEPLWREVLGARLRRHDRNGTLAETAATAGISPQYLSEIERGRKEPSSEMIAAIAGALGTSLTDLTGDVAGELQRQQQQQANLGAAPTALALAA
jgi:transcriptional regulator with XRE-family HTH domain